MYKNVTIIVFGLFACGWSMANDGLADLVRSSDVIAKITIVSGVIGAEETVGCGVAYDGIVLESLKGSVDGSKISFRVRNSYYVGEIYLVFITENVVPNVGRDQIEGVLGYSSKECAEFGVSNTIVPLTSKIDHKAIFELRMLSELGKEKSGPYFVGPGAAIGLLGPGIETHTLRIHRPYGAVFQGAIQADLFAQEIRESVKINQRSARK